VRLALVEARPVEPSAELGDDEPKGIRCRKCHCRDLRVIYTRHYANKIVRRRECRHCGTRLTTTERMSG